MQLHRTIEAALVDGAKHRSSLDTRGGAVAEPDQDAKPQLTPFVLALLSAPRGQERRRMAGLCLADLRPIAGFARASDERGGGDVKEM